MVDAFASGFEADTVPELAVMVIAPGHHRAVGKQRQTEVAARSDRDHVGEAGDLTGNLVQGLIPEFPARPATADSELAETVFSPQAITVPLASSARLC